jgi:methyl-accepting chemotaxis protein
MNFEKGDVLGVLYDDENVIHGLWFSDESFAHDDITIRAMLAAQKATKGRTTSEEDYLAATTGLCPTRSAGATHGGFFLLFPSVNRGVAELEKMLNDADPRKPATTKLDSRSDQAMKNFLQYLLMFFALCLCGLVAFQWDRETKLQQKVQSLTDTVQDKLENIQSLQGTLKRTEDEVKRLDGLKSELTETVKSNRVEIAQFRKDLEKAGAEIGKDARQIGVYKTALEQANENIKKQNEDIKTQNEELKKLASERNDTVAKFKKLAEEYNDLVKKWNDQQTALSSTNVPPAPKK